MDKLTANAQIYTGCEWQAHVKGLRRYKPERIIVPKSWRQARVAGGVSSVRQVACWAGKGPGKDWTVLPGPFSWCRCRRLFHERSPRPLPGYTSLRPHRLLDVPGFDIGVVASRVRIDSGVGGLARLGNPFNGHASIVQFKRSVEGERISRDNAEATLCDCFYGLGRPWTRFPAVVLPAVLEPDLGTRLAASTGIGTRLGVGKQVPFAPGPNSPGPPSRCAWRRD